MPFSFEPPSADLLKPLCPQCGCTCHEVSSRTIRHQIRQPWRWQELAYRYYFCGNPNCDLIYWGDDGSSLLKSRLRQDDPGMDLVCCCFGVTEADLLEDQTVHSFMVSQTREKQCACEVRNPAGRCCLSTLKHFSESGTNANIA